MGDRQGFTNGQLEQLADAAEIQVETEAAGTRHSTTIWVVVVDDGVFIRSVMGAGGHWYRRALREGNAVIRVRGSAIPVRVEPEGDAELNQRVDEAYRRKYAGRWPRETAGVLASDVAQTTLRLVPA